MLKLTTQDSLRYAIRTMHDNDVFAAPITDTVEFDPDNINHSDPYVGIIDLASMLLWFHKVQNRNFFFFIWGGWGLVIQ